MTFRRRLIYLSAAAVAAAVLIASALVYVLVRGELRGQVDDGLRTISSNLSDRHRGPGPEGPGPGDVLGTHGPLGGPTGYSQVVDARGEVLGPELVTANGTVIQVRNLQPALPVSTAAKAVAAGTGGAFLEDARADGAHVRVITVPGPGGTALQVARPLSEVDATLSRLRLVLLLVSLGGIAAAAVLGRTVARRALKPVEELTEAAEHVAHTRDLSRRMSAEGSDELSRLAASFNTMLEALDASQAAQRQLVADASHELRTPLTSLRTNLEVLARGDVLPPAERERLLRRATGQLEELSVLVGDLVDLARGAESEADPEVLRLDLLVEEAVDRARAHAPDAHVALEVFPTLVSGVPSRLYRAVSNLLDNALKWSPPREVIEVTVRGGEVAVRDHGPGIADDDLPFVFDRFYRAASARGLPGSGLGLAIVRQVAESHGGRAWAEHAPGGGARLCIALPVAREPVEPAQPLVPAAT